MDVQSIYCILVLIGPNQYLEEM